ncbi:MAG: dTMP kinase [Devosia sp.]|nr:dTMP kinase [Devosia sp.]
MGPGPIRFEQGTTLPMLDASQASRARFITFEGGEGVGKSTQVKRLLASLAETSIQAVRTREPGGTPKAEAVRSFILQGRSESWGAGGEAVLFAAARLNHVNELIAPNLAAGKWVISDRFHDSTRAYQGLTGGVDDKLIAALEALALDGHAPDLTIVLDMDPEIAFRRVAQRAIEDGLALTGDRFEKEDIEWHKRLRDSFLSIAKANPNRCVVISADQGEDALEAAIWAVVSDKFPEVTGRARA